ncbi:cell wall-binding repeat-containing protein [Clostridium aciditolerans]|uniref:Cell wall-binding repeat-containing protein n=1 Tax=Clostridium aciditolerans TaxID=339861 RepID=A0A934HZG3_9CLOT|nr:cell wall-binding repeat-containing protein [Clostridium aciditolerans]MBI6873578.1 cell wall-binding repeat-containing protein [Clostridium aciditolerans]
MSKKGTKALASATLMSLVLTTALSAGPVKAAAGQAERIGAADRYATAAQVATKNWTTSDNVVLVSGEGYADAVSASALAKKLNAPILLTTAKTLSTDTASALSKLGAKNVYVVGGEASVSTAVRNELKKTYSLVELGGANRYETNVAVAQKLVDLGVDPSSVIMVGGEGFSDALSVAPVAAAKGQILLLGMNNADYMKPVLDFVAKNKSKVTVVGTKNVISDSILSTVNGTRVDGGKDRWDTNQKVLANFKDTVKMDKLYVASAAYNAQDNGYADALVASALAGKYAAPLVLVDKDGNEGTTNALNYIKNNANKSTDLQVVGGTGVVSDGLLGKITEAVTGVKPGPGNTTVKSVEAVDLNQLRVNFNTDVDSDSAEDVGNYKIDGSTLSDKDAVAVLGDDNRTLLITLKQPKEQQKQYTVSVKQGVLTADKSGSIDAFDQKISFSDTTAPAIASVSVKGNNKITVNFTEPVKIPVTAVGSVNPTNDFISKFKINGQNISSFGLDTTVTEVDHQIATTTAARIESDKDSVWADKVDFYFSTKLPAGSNTLKVSDGTANGVLSDAAGFIVKEKEENFNVDTVSTKPVIKEVKASTDNTIKIIFDRPMDTKTAKVISNYKLNNDSLSGKVDPKDISLKEGDCTVKIKHVPGINFGSNTIYVSNSVKDAYGNKVADDTRVNFTMEKDETKPTVTSVRMVDSETIRMSFSKDIDASYAIKAANYTLKDASNVDISSHIRLVKPSYKSVSDSVTSGAIKDDTFGADNSWDIKLYKNAYDYQTIGKGKTYDPVTQATTIAQLKNDDWRLTAAKYTLIIKNLADTTANKNVMDDSTNTINGSDDVAPKMNANAYAKDKHKVVVTFSEAMDGSQLDKLDNYKYKNAAGDSKQLPSDTKITVGNDDKSVTLEFPDNYYTDLGDGTTVDGTNITSYDNDNRIRGILASNLKDLQGNLIDSFNNSSTISASATGSFAYKDSTYRIQKDGDDLLVKVQFQNAIDPDSALKEYFMVAGQTPDSVSVSGSDVILRFNNDDHTDSSANIVDEYTANHAKNGLTNLSGSTDKADKADIIKLWGSFAKVQVKATDAQGKNGLKDITGASIATDAQFHDLVSRAYDYLAAPETTSDYWYATTQAGTTDAAVVLTFDTVLDPIYSGVKADDFRFNVGGTEVKAERVVVKGNSLVFLFENDKQVFANGKANKKKVSVSLKNANIDVEALRDDNSNNAKFVPSSDDKTKTRDIILVDTDITSQR